MDIDEAFVWPEEWEKAIPALTHMVISVCRRRGVSAADFDDMVQIVLMRVVIEADARKRQFGSIPLLCGWCRKFLSSQLRKRDEARSRDKVTKGMDVSTLPNETDEPTDIEDMSVYLALLDDRRHREVLSLRFDGNLTFEQIADRLGCSRSQAQKLHQAAVELLRRRLAR